MIFFEVFLLFIIYSIIGYIYEMGVLLVVDKKIVLKRGFFFGPYIPIYGFGMLFMAFALGFLADNIILLFLASLVSAGILEYVTSYLMEKIYGYRWWDYTYSKYNLNGRVTLELLIMFGIDGILVVNYINPFFTNIISSVPTNIIVITSSLLMILFLIDLIISVVVSVKIKDEVRKIANKDATTIIKKEAKKYIEKYIFRKI